MTERDGVENVFTAICEDMLDDPNYRRTDAILTLIADIQQDQTLELLVREFLSATDDMLADTIDEISSYTQYLYETAASRNPRFSYDDIALAIDGVRTRIEGSH